jgi:Ribbon-helix-helix protein, copG family
MPNVSPVRYTTVFTMRVDQDFLDAVDKLRRLRTPILSKSNVIRVAVMDALKRAKAKGKRRAA